MQPPIALMVLSLECSDGLSTGLRETIEDGSWAEIRRKARTGSSRFRSRVRLVAQSEFGVSHPANDIR